MPEIKNTFVQGKMNKDLDERIVPNGQYRDAVNIQVSTSDEAGVGTVQNILGNTKIGSLTLPDNSSTWECVGSIADEKNDVLYSFITDDVNSVVVEYTKSGSANLVVVDLTNTVLKFSTGNIITGINIIDGLLFWTDGVNEPKKINIERCKAGTSDFSTHTKLVVNNNDFSKIVNTLWTQDFSDASAGTTDLYLSNLGTASNPNVKIGDELIEFESGNNNNINTPSNKNVTAVDYANGIVTINTSIYNGTGIANTGQYVKFATAQPLKEEHITVIKKKPTQAPRIDFNIIDDTSANSGSLNSFSISGVTVGQTSVSISAPMNRRKIWESGSANLTPDPYTLITGDTVSQSFATSNSITIYDGIPYGVNDGDILLLSDPSAQGVLPNNAQIRFLVTTSPTVTMTAGFGATGGSSADDPEYTQTFTGTILSIDSGTSLDSIQYDFVVEDLNDLLFTKSFPRFAYRYKYEDGEYSAFSPFTQVGFTVGEFSIHPTKEPYNSAMETRVKSIALKEFITHDIPLNVVEVDLLYKPDNSTTVYSIETIKPSAVGTNGPWELVGLDYASSPPGEIDTITLPSGNELVASNTGYYRITADNIHAALPSNQLLRPWDNVPKTAKAQEVTGNRLVYGNYVQNLKLEDYTPYIVTRYQKRSFPGTDIDYSDGKQSVKSQRTYQGGIVFGDKYGRETPVFSGGGNHIVKIPYDNDQTVVFNGMASRSNRLYVRHSPVDLPIMSNDNNSTLDYEPYYFKIFIKETASEYYNLVMDRVYRAEEDGNLWISFPSSDRNKIQEDDYIILKKGLGTLGNPATQVPFENKYKVIDIKNEAPEFIKKKYQEIGQLDGDGTLTGPNGLYLNGAQPFVGTNSLIISKDSFLNEGLADIQHEYDKGTKQSLTFKVTNANGDEIISQRYKIISLTTTDSTIDFYTIILDKAIVQADGWVETSIGVLDTSLKTTIWIEEQQEWEEFQGRFFVKILSDIVTDEYLESQIGTIISTTLEARTKLFYISDQTATNNGAPTTSNPSPGIHGSGLFQGLHGFDSQQSNTPNVKNQSLSDTKGEWADENLEFDNGQTSEGWFIDHAFSAAQQPTILSDTSGWSNHDSSASIYDASVSGNLREAHSQKVNGMTGIVETDKYYTDESFGRFMWIKQFGNGQVRSGSGSSFSNYKETNVYGNENGKHYMHLSFSGVGEHLAPDGPTITQGNSTGTSVFNKFTLHHIHNYNQQNDTTTYPFNHSDITQDTAYVPDPNIYEKQWDITHNHPENEAILQNLVVGSKFQFENDVNETIFTILKVTKKHLYNHTAWNRTYVWDHSALENVLDDVDVPVGTSVWAAWHKWRSLSGGNSTNIANWNSYKQKVKNFAAPHNRRVCFIIELDKNPSTEVYDGTNTGIQSVLKALTNNNDLGASAASNLPQTPGFLKFIKNYISENSTVLSDDPAVWETEPKENTDLDIYYEASDAIPLKLDLESTNSDKAADPDNRKGHMIAPVGTAVRCTKTNSHTATTNFGDCVVKSWDGRIVQLDPGLTALTDDIDDGSGGTTPASANSTSDQTELFEDSTLRFYRKDLSYVEVGIDTIETIDTGKITKIALNRTLNKNIGLPYFNCFTFGNGVESNRIRDDFNQPFISNGARASSTLQEQYKEENRKSGLIYSGIYNDTGGINNLNQFIMAEKITKDLNPTYGSIQKLFSRRISLIAFCEDRVVGITANKNALYNADGDPQIVASDAVLGDANPFVGDYGISKNPESFAKESYRAYFTDRQRGAVLRLSMDGLTPISDAGMSDWFKDEFKDDTHVNIIGSYDNYKNDYNLTFDRGDNTTYGIQGNTSGHSQTVTYSEDVKGWTSFKSFIQESGISMSGDYYTFNAGQCYKHHDNSTRNSFYGASTNSNITFLLNESPLIIKNYNTLNYDGDESWICNSIETDQQGGTVSSFIEKEGKWFNYISGNDNVVDTQAFNFQGIGIANDITSI
tara:strand:- start:4276 stop:10155 length:5880 start_codon:yes stop_codon:yes gene_type:complete